MFWLELFDHVTKTSVDSFRCDRIKDAAAVFEDFMSQGANLNRPRRSLTLLPSPSTGSMPADGETSTVYWVCTTSGQH